MAMPPNPQKEFSERKGPACVHETTSKDFTQYTLYMQKCLPALLGRKCWSVFKIANWIINEVKS